MQTFLSDALKQTPRGIEADRILRSCVHCGFCTATCPTYRLTGDELDSPRGRIYLIKGVLEGKPAGYRTQFHLDRCLTCRACETACPSGVEYEKLLAIGRELISGKVSRPWYIRLFRFLLRKTLITPRWFAVILRTGQILRPVMPGFLKHRIPIRYPHVHRRERIYRAHPRQTLLFSGCVQPALAPGIHPATIRVLDRIGISAVTAVNEVCCGAISHHMTVEGEARALMRKNIDSWWPYIESGVEAIVINASGCGAMIRKYGDLLRDDPVYAEKARKISDKVRDIAEMFSDEDLTHLREAIQPTTGKITFHSPCSLQHGQKLAGVTENLLARLGFPQTRIPDAHICCGSAGVYSILQGDLAGKLKSDKLQAMTSGNPEVIVTSNIGCQIFLQQSTDIPVRHWVEVIDEMLNDR